MNSPIADRSRISPQKSMWFLLRIVPVHLCVCEWVDCHENLFYNNASSMLKYLHGTDTIHEPVNDIWPDQQSLNRSRLNWYRPIEVKKIRVDMN